MDRKGILEVCSMSVVQGHGHGNGKVASGMKSVVALDQMPAPESEFLSSGAGRRQLVAIEHPKVEWMLAEGLRTEGHLGEHTMGLRMQVSLNERAALSGADPGVHGIVLRGCVRRLQEGQP